MPDGVEPEEIERAGREVGNAAEELTAAARGLTESGSELGARMIRAIAAVRDFADELETAGRGWSAPD